MVSNFSEEDRDGGEIPRRRRMMYLLRVVVLGLAWFIFSALSSIYIKRTINILPAVAKLTLLEFAVGAVMTWLYLVLLRREIRVTPTIIKSFVPVSIAYALGHILTNYSFGATSLAFAHTVKALEPFVAVILQRILGDSAAHSKLMYLSFIPISAGIGLASTGSMKFTWRGFFLAMASNLCFGTRNVLSKKTSTSSGVDVIDCFLILSILGTVYTIPLWLLCEYLYGDWMNTQIQDMSPESAVDFLLSAGIGVVAHWIYNQASFNFLFLTSPITHSVANAARRLFLIVAALLYFSHSVSGRAGMGVSLTLCGIMVYSYAVARQRERVTLPHTVQRT
ncbi:uncharacterized protein LOC135821674 [Sycon ciliatum]|uniref:uncharacterized protein LOC135821674 n=1 Tax=Sycon ciliatum TaxID=27933 RepID=UPI0020AD4CF6|eukprot:scpid8071/ scgid32912/ Phosphoenolpyruvate/phosphate translocator 2, chloroplastic